MESTHLLGERSLRGSCLWESREIQLNDISAGPVVKRNLPVASIFPPGRATARGDHGISKGTRTKRNVEKTNLDLATNG